MHTPIFTTGKLITAVVRKQKKDNNMCLIMFVYFTKNETYTIFSDINVFD